MNQYTPSDEFQLPAVVPATWISKSEAKQLSAAETAALKSLADGLTMKEIAYLHDVSESAIKQRISRAKRKLSARTTTQCVAIAVGLGLFLFKPAP